MKDTMTEPAKSKAASRRAGRLLLVLFALNGVLVATHLGEFWPFSIYPMFSQATTEIHNVVVRQISEEEAAQDIFADQPANDLMGEPYGVRERGVDPVDLAKYVRLTKDWDDDRLRGLVRMFAPSMGDEKLVVLEVRGDIAGAEEPDFIASPTVVFDRDGARYVGSELVARSSR